MDHPPFTLSDLLREHGHSRPAHPALTCGDETLSYGALDQRVDRVASAIFAAGVGPGDRVAVLARNSIAWYEVMLAVARIRAVLVGVNFRLAATEVAAILEDAEPTMVFVGEEHAHLVLPASNVVVLGAEFERWLGSTEERSPAPVAGVAAGSELAGQPEPDDVVLHIYSSGTTGMPKGAMITNANLSWTPKMGREVYEMSPESVNLLTSPLFHIGGAGYSLTGFGLGAHTVIATDLDAHALLSQIQAHRVTHAFLVPTVIRLLLEGLPTIRADLSSLQLVAYGASPIDERTLLEAIAAFGSRFLGVYGMTEAAGSVTALLPEDHDPGGPRAHLLRSVGRSLPWHKVQVTDPLTGMEVPAGNVGEVWVHSPQTMTGYWGQPELTSATVSDDGWLHTGDAAWQDENGYIYIHDRLKDMIISGGENIYPAEVERVLAEHPAVREVAVVGVPDPRWGETVKAIIAVVSGAEATEAELIAFSRSRLAHFKCPTSVDFVDELTRNASGKVLKRLMRKAYWDDSTAK